ncbi:hypothetical protein SDC9_84487 [bioreactor metagenome]|uniref:Uncharacterized protein n=1 Tax=bioreactor metagenome TaxID=1076179 RepID=A0A644ZC58_9ZZZZ
MIGPRFFGFIGGCFGHHRAERVTARRGNRDRILGIRRARCGRDGATAGNEGDVCARRATRDADGEGIVAVFGIRPAGDGERSRSGFFRDAADRCGNAVIAVIACASRRQRIGANRVHGDLEFFGGYLGDGAADRGGLNLLACAAAIDARGEGFSALCIVHPAFDMHRRLIGFAGAAAQTRGVGAVIVLVSVHHGG